VTRTIVERARGVRIVHDRNLLQDRLLHRRIFLGVEQRDQGLRVPVDHQGLEHLALIVLCRELRVHPAQRVARHGIVRDSDPFDRLSSDLRVRALARHLRQLIDVSRDAERFEELCAQRRVLLGAPELLERGQRIDRAQSVDRLGADARVGVGLRDGEELFRPVGGDVGVDDRVAHLRWRGSVASDRGERREIVGVPGDPESLDRLAP
jgi:hypothetical protein